MGLVHQFAIIPKDSNENIISAGMDSVSIPDMLIQYMGGSLRWVHTIWNGKKLQEGISYYGFSVIENDEIIKFRNIMKQWQELFCLSPEEFYLTGNYLLDEQRYENNLVKREEIIDNLNSCILICEKAINGGFKILHNGI